MHLNAASQALLATSRRQKRALAVAIDTILCVATVFIAYYLRLGYWSLPRDEQWISVFLAPSVAIPLYIRFGLYRAIFRYVGWDAFLTVIRACFLYLAIYAGIFTLIGIENVPRTVGIIQPILLFLAIGGTRTVAKSWFGASYQDILRRQDRPRTLIYGAGSAGRQLAAALDSGDDMQVVGFVDDDPRLRGHLMNGRMIYAAHDLLALLERLTVEDLLIAIPSASRRRRREIVEAVQGTSVRIRIRILPGVSDLAQGRITISDLREVDISDLLGRDAALPNPDLMRRRIAGKRVLVTGAGGSIGSELCRQIIQNGPAMLVLLEITEFALYAIHRELEQIAHDHDVGCTLVPILGSVRDQDRMTRLFDAWRPQTVYHAAAYKHVPLVESNPSEGVRNNVLGTIVAARTADAHRVDDFVLVSTDKAVRPTNIMGATKRLAEMTLQTLAARGSRTRYSMVRFGNVLGSSGSVVPLFHEQIRIGGPITITHEDITRYFMTIPEAAQLVVQAGAMAQGGEVFVLNMGEPVRIIELARTMIGLSGLTERNADHPDGDIEIVTVGLRPGEKLYEELLIGDNPEDTPHDRIMKVSEPFLDEATLDAGIAQLCLALEQEDAEAIRAIVCSLVPEYVPDRKVVDWLYLNRMQQAERPRATASTG